MAFRSEELFLRLPQTRFGAPLRRAEQPQGCSDKNGRAGLMKFKNPSNLIQVFTFYSQQLFFVRTPTFSICSKLGSAQQYHASVKCGTPTSAPKICNGFTATAPNPANSLALFSILPKISPRPIPARSPSLTIPLTSFCNSSTRASPCVHGYANPSLSNSPTSSRTSPNSINRDPAGISSLIDS